ncbi:MAG: hypothetical protein U1F41_14430 [Burkholderiales bacterium]
MNRPDAVTMHMNARPYRSRLIGYLIRRFLRDAVRRSRGAASRAPRAAAARYPMPQQ